ncbi:TetR/AcrR family transcriptional regulator [Arthrobacter sp. HLT1-21]
MTEEPGLDQRVRLNRDRVLQAAVSLADEFGVDSLSMRRLARELRVVPMALYKHVSNKEELLDGMVETIVAEIDPPATGVDWKSAVRLRILSARHALQQHRWARRVIESRTTKTPAVLAYMDTFIGMFLAGGFSADLTHHVMHALGGRMWGFTQELFDDHDTSVDQAAMPPAIQDVTLQRMSEFYPNIAVLAAASAHDSLTVVGQGCDDQFEFEFVLKLLLDGFERLHQEGWTSRSGLRVKS